jgi:hypothetical protein
MRDSNGNEIDIIFKKQGVLTAVEIKSSSTFNPVFFRGMEKLHLNGIPVKKQIVVYAGKTLELSSGNLVVNYCNANRIFNSES